MKHSSLKYNTVTIIQKLKNKHASDVFKVTGVFHYTLVVLVVHNSINLKNSFILSLSLLNLGEHNSKNFILKFNKSIELKFETRFI